MPPNSIVIVAVLAALVHSGQSPTTTTPSGSIITTVRQRQLVPVEPGVRIPCSPLWRSAHQVNAKPPHQQRRYLNTLGLVTRWAYRLRDYQSRQTVQPGFGPLTGTRPSNLPAFSPLFPMRQQ